MSEILQTPSAEPILTEDGFIVDPVSGEIAGLSEISPNEDLKSQTEKYLERRARVNARAEGLRREMDVLIAGVRERFETMIREQESRIKWLDHVFGPGAQAFAAERLSGGKAKSLKLPWGTIGFRAKPERFAVLQPDAALEWAKANLPGAVQVKESVLVSEIPQAARPHLPAGVFEWRQAGTEQEFYVKHGGDA